MISIECFKGIPLEYDSFLIEKYGSFLTTCRYIEIYCTSYEIHYMLVYENSILIELLIFGNKGNCSICFNSYVFFEENIISACSKILIENYPQIKKIIFQLSYSKFDFRKSFLVSKSNDHILNLPLTIDDYYLELGKTTRQHLKNYKVKLLRDFPQVNFVIKFKSEIKEPVIERIVQLNIERMKFKGIIPGKELSDKNNIFKYVQYYGCIAYIEKDGLILAGSISYILNNRIFLYIIAHDNNYSRYNPGQICIVYLIRASIDKRLSTFHFLSGDNEYKARLLGTPHPMYSTAIYKKYSFDYFTHKIEALFRRALIQFRLSKYSKPIRDSIKFYRKNKWIEK
jgi:hypothetical protein